MPTMKIEIRGDQVTIQGYVNVVERKSKPIMDLRRATFTETVAQGTFKNALTRAKNVDLLLDHNRKLTDTKSGNLQLTEDNIGLYAKAIVKDADFIKIARAGELRGWSFGFYPIQDEWSEGNGMQARTLKEIDLREVSILSSVTPAYAANSIEVRGEEIKETREFMENVEIIEERSEEHAKQEETDKKAVNLDEYYKRLEALKGV